MNTDIAGAAAPDCDERRPHLAAVLVRVTALDLVAILPVSLAGALGVLIARDLDESLAIGGLMVAAYFAAGAVAAIATRSLSDRLGWRRTATVGLVLIASGSVLAAAAPGPALLLLAALLAGTGAAHVQPATSAYISSAVPSRHTALAMNVKVAAAPAALLIAGLSIPALAEGLGWRPTFLLALGLPCIGLALVWIATSASPGRRSPDDREALAQAPTPKVLAPVVLAIGLGAMVPGCIIAFTVPSLIDVGYSTAAAGAILAMLSGMTIISRVGIGLAGHHPRLGSYRSVGVLMLIGGAGAALMLAHNPVLLVVGGVFAFTVGFGWMGQAFAIGVREYPDNPGAASALLQSGGMAGSAVGPLVGAAVAHSLGVQAVWIFAALASTCGATILLRRPFPRTVDRYL